MRVLGVGKPCGLFLNYFQSDDYSELHDRQGRYVTDDPEINIRVEDPEPPELIDFDEEELQEFNEDELPNSRFGHSVVSTETEKRGAEFKKKV